jgi:hypothetical protein
LTDDNQYDQNQETDFFPPGCGLWFGWIFVSLIGSVVGWMMGWRISYIAPGQISTIVIGAVMGLCLGVLQWLVIRTSFNGSLWWIPLTILGWAIGFPAGVYIAQSFGLSGFAFGLAIGLVIGTFLGLFQFLFLQARVPNSFWWIPASIFGWGSSMFYYQPGMSWVSLLYGALSGIVTGIALLWILHRPVAEEPASQPSSLE